VLAAEEGIDLAESITAEVEGDEESFSAVLSHEDGLEHVDVGPACFVFLFHQQGIPDVHEVEFVSLFAAFLRHRGQRVDAAVDSHAMPVIRRKSIRPHAAISSSRYSWCSPPRTSCALIRQSTGNSCRWTLGRARGLLSESGMRGRMVKQFGRLRGRRDSAPRPRSPGESNAAPKG
jgi:hypothetical protein